MLKEFYEMTADMKSNTKLSPIVTGLFMGGKKLNILLVFISQSCFKIPKDIQLHDTLFHHENT